MKEETTENGEKLHEIQKDRGEEGSVRVISEDQANGAEEHAKCPLLQFLNTRT